MAQRTHECLNGIRENIKTFVGNGFERIRVIDVSSVGVFDLKMASKKSAAIQNAMKTFLDGFGLLKFQLGVMAQNLEVYKQYVHDNTTIGMQKMNALVKLLPYSYYVHTRKVNPNNLYQ